MKDGKSGFIRRKSVELENTNVQKPDLENIDTAFRLLEITGHRTRTINLHPSGGINHIPIEDEETRPSSDRGPVSKVVNLPKLHESKRPVDDNEGVPDAGTIRRPFDGNKTLRPLVVQAFSRNMTVPESNIPTPGTETVIQRPPTIDTDAEVSTSLNEVMLKNDSNPISQFPPVEEDEIDKHRHMNEEAEKNSSSKPPPNRYQNYLKRLRLDRKTIQDKKLAEMKLMKKKMIKRTQTKPKFAKDFKDDLFAEKPVTPPKPKEVEAKPVKLILGFRYSYAVEQYYRGQMKHPGSAFSLYSEDINNAKDEVMNGWLVKSLGPTVLNLRARTLPSCNPIEIRLRRRHQMKTRDLSRSRGLNRTLSQESLLSRGLLKSRESFSKLNTIEEDRESRHSNQGSHEKKVVISPKVNLIGLDDSNAVSKVTSLPPLFTANSIGTGAPQAKKAISLRLPHICAEE
jgi:hypothetical protein